jgi:peptide/nickel transport system substrate-binding protein
VALGGGTLRVAMDIRVYESFQLDVNVDPPRFNNVWDPSRTWVQEPFELFRCCLLRTLMAYNGLSTSEGGAELRPDLAADYPEISADGLTWTFRLREGIHYAPPMAEVEIKPSDFVRALERTLRPDPFTLPDEDAHAFGPYATYFTDVIAGAEEFSAGSVQTISGLEARDEEASLAIHLTRPAGDLGARLAMPAAAPIPPGAAVGHDAGYGPYLVASGPYMMEGAHNLQPSLPPDQQPPVSGYVPGESLTLVRNPSWDRASDPLRTAFAERIEVVHSEDYEAELQAINEGLIDVQLSFHVEPEDLGELRADSATASRLFTTPILAADWIFMNVAVPPFDDVHVRRAVNLATNKRAIADQLHPDGVVLRHAIPDSFENGLLADYRPYATVDDAGSIEQARAEMRLSRYDTDGDGVCDDPACIGIHVPVKDDLHENALAADEFATNLAPLGIELDVEPVSLEEFFGLIFDPASHTPLVFTFGWGSDFHNASSWFEPLATGSAIATEFGGNMSMIGASAEQLSEFGYTVTQVPSLDSRITACVALTGAAQFECWSEVDQYLMERVVPWVPIDVRQISWLTSPRVTRFRHDASLAMPSLAEIAVSQDQ